MVRARHGAAVTSANHPATNRHRERSVRVFRTNQEPFVLEGDVRIDLDDVLLVGANQTLVRAKIEVNLPHKRGAAAAGYDKVGVHCANWGQRPRGSDIGREQGNHWNKRGAAMAGHTRSCRVPGDMLEHAARVLPSCTLPRACAGCDRWLSPCLGIFCYYCLIICSPEANHLR